jgi:DNA-binding NarL/FixJ family response regulator
VESSPALTGPHPGREPLGVAVAANDPLTLRRLAAVAAGDDLVVTHAARSLEELAGLGAPDTHLLVAACDPTDAGVRRALRELTGSAEAPGMVVVSRQETPAAVKAAVRAGAGAVLFESDLEPVLGLAARAVAAGQVCVPAAGRAHVRREALSSREKQVLGLVVMGLTNVEIAGRLFLAESTVKSHLSSAFTKLGVSSRTDAAALILDPDEGLGTGILAIAGPHAQQPRAGLPQFTRPTITERTS